MPENVGINQRFINTNQTNKFMKIPLTTRCGCKNHISSEILLKMKLTIILLIAAFFQVQAKGYSQQITLSQKNAQLEDVFKQIMKQTDYHFLYLSQALQDAKPVDIELKDASLTEALEQCFKGQYLTYILDDNTVIVKAVPPPPPPITGKVTNEKGEPIPGVSVVIKGSTKGTVTDTDGKYSIEVKENEKILVFSYIGMKTLEINIDGRLAINVVLQQEIAKLDEVVVTGYQTISKERVTGATSKVSSAQWADKRMNSLNSIVEGKIAGYNNGLIRGVTSMVGNATPLYVIDGFPVENTRFNSYGSLEEAAPNLNVEDIESITVLKDAAAASIYGARAANGVVVIVTKKGAKGETTVSFSNTITTTPYYNYTGNLADASTLIGLETEWAKTNPKLQAGAGDPAVAAYAQSYLDNAVYTSQGIKSWLNYYAGNMTESELQSKLNGLSAKGYSYYNDVEKYGKRNKLAQQYNVSISKANDKNSLHASFTYKNDKLEDKYTGNESFGININNTTYIKEWLQLDLGTYTNYSDGTAQTYNLNSPGYTYLAYDNFADANGNPLTNTAADRYSLYDQSKLTNYGLYNMDITPINEVSMNQSKTKDFINRTYARLTIKFTNWLKYSAAYQNEYGNYSINQLQDKSSYNVRSMVNTFASVNYNTGQITYMIPYGHIYNTSTNATSGYNFRQQLDFNKSYNDKHDLTAIAGFEVRDNKVSYNSQSLYNYDPEMLSYSQINAADLASHNYNGAWSYGSFSNSNVAYQRELDNRYVSIYGNAAYSYIKKYTLTGSLRWDRSNLWGTNSKYQKKPTWSVGGVWNIGNEAFFTSSSVNMLKLRASYGIGGNIAKNAAPYMTAYYFNNNNVGGLQGIISGRPNPELSWEQTATANIGVDFALLKNRLNGSVDVYNKKGKDLLANSMGVPTEGFGYSTYKINNGEMTNKGFEISLSGEAIQSEDFHLRLSGIFAYNKNEVTYVNVEAPVYYLQLDQPQAYPRIGNPYHAIYGYKWAGLSATGLPQVYDKDGNKVSYQPTNLEDIVYLGTNVPKYNGSFNVDMNYKRWSLTMLLIYEGGHKVRNTFLPTLPSEFSMATYSYLTPVSGSISANIADRWQKPGDEATTNIPRTVFAESPDYSYDLNTIYSMADINVLDASNIRLSNISLNYNLPSELCHKMYFKDARLQFNVENVFMIAKSPEAKYMLGGYIKPSYVFGLYLNF